jgi:hypothetical protein
MTDKAWTLWLAGSIWAVALALPACWAQQQEDLTQVPGQDTAAAVPPPSARRPMIQVALVLDTGDRMSGLVEQARIEAWAIANELLLLDKAGRSPIVEMGIVAYGNGDMPIGRGAGRVAVPLTTDIDMVSMGLGQARIRGGQEYCGWAIQEAVQRLAWSPYPEDMRVIFIAGNESFTQGSVDYPSSCQAAAAKMIIVNAVYCGPYNSGVHYGWTGASESTAGQYISISVNKPPRYRPTPSDNELLDLNRRLNETYRLLTDPSRELLKRQQDQDRDVWQLSREAVFQRIVTKAAVGLAQNAAGGGEQANGSEINKTLATTKEIDQIKAQTDLRRQIEQQILELGRQRRLALMAGEPEPSQQGHTLGSAVIQVLREQVAKRGFTFERLASEGEDQK